MPIAFVGPDVEAGVIVMWSGAVETIPAGYALCDGTLGTPNLKDKFVISAGAVFGPGDSGGSQSHVHQFTGDGHAHDLAGGTIIEDVDPTGSINHSTTTEPASGTTDAGTNMPPYYTLAFIMKL